MHVALLENWERWTSFLGKQVETAKNIGVSNNLIEKTAVQIGNYLAENVDPKNEQERVLADLWSVASEKEKHVLANCVIKLVQSNRVH
jgi:hypothetical protein